MSTDRIRSINRSVLEQWAVDDNGPVALHLRQQLKSVEAGDGAPSIIYPPTYADIGYNIDTLADGSKVALIDSIGSQANRMEPVFKRAAGNQSPNPLAELIPQIDIVIRPGRPAPSGDGPAENEETRSILDLAHRSADAVVRSTPDLMQRIEEAFEILRQSGDSGPLCALAPTSLVFGVWDSRGTGEKRPRIVRSIIRAWDVEELHAAAQFNSIWKILNADQKSTLEKQAKANKVKLSEKGLADAPSVFKSDKVPHVKDGKINPDARVLGGIIVNGNIIRDVTVNLIALRGIQGSDPTETERIRKYLLALSLLVATEEIDLFLREGCNLRYTGDDEWFAVPRRGDEYMVDLNTGNIRQDIMAIALDGASHFRPRWPETRYRFDIKEAQKLLAKKDDAPTSEA